MARAARLATSSILLASLAVACASGMTAAAAQVSSVKIPNSQLEPLAWSDLSGWAEDDHMAAFKTFMDSCKAILPRTSPGREAGPMFTALQNICRRGRTDTAADIEQARAFFEMNFRPVRIATLGEAAGFPTGYY
jgi:membrane-bound lytic murein transglycosylase A